MRRNNLKIGVIRLYCFFITQFHTGSFIFFFFFFSSRRRHTRWTGDWSSDVCSSDLKKPSWLVTTINSAELIKHASNSFLAIKISYANMVSDLAEKLGANIEEVMNGVGLDPRIGSHFLKPGLGFGGFCLPKDLQAFVRLARSEEHTS